ncbi:MAG: hypothetical protein J6X32_07180 [Salinivirgaceae bacterium]|nr:hypothetical protein [Salinivirgaceae bacterium]
MKHALKILSVLLLTLTMNHSFAQSDDLVNVCALGIGNATYLKDFKVKLPANSPAQKFSVILTKGFVYKFVVCNAEGYEGKAVIQLSEGNNALVSNLKPDGSFAEAVGFSCQKTGMYNIFCSFKNNKEGAAVIIMSYITK